MCTHARAHTLTRTHTHIHIVLPTVIFPVNLGQLFATLVSVLQLFPPGLRWIRSVPSDQHVTQSSSVLR